MPQYWWYPDVCPGRKPCRLEFDADWKTLRGADWCPHHRQVHEGGTDALQVVRDTCSAKEHARAAIKREMMKAGKVDKEFPGVPFTVGDDGSIVIDAEGDVELAAVGVAEIRGWPKADRIMVR